MTKNCHYLFFYAATDAIGVAAKSHRLPGSIVKSRGRRYGNLFALTAHVEVNPRQAAAFELAVEELSKCATAIFQAIEMTNDVEVAPLGAITVTIASYDRDQLLMGSCEAITSAQRQILAYGGSRLSASFDGNSLFVVRAVVSDGDEGLLRASLENFCNAHGAEYTLSDRLPLRGLAPSEFAINNHVFEN